MQTKAVLFDLDGTILDTAPDLIQACSYTLNKYGITTIDEDKIKRVLTQGMRAMMASCIKKDELHKFDLEGEMRNCFANYYSSHINVKTRPFANIEKLLNLLVAKQVKIGIITNKYVKMAQSLLSNYTFTKYFEFILGGDSLALAKPDPYPLQFALEKLKLQACELIYVGDHSNDIICANRANVTSALALWGYGTYECDFSTLKIDIKLKDPLELLNYID